MRSRTFPIATMLSAALTLGLLAAQLSVTDARASGPPDPAKERARMLLSQPLPALSGDHLKAILVEVRYGPGEASPPHSHPCAVVGYVVQGAVRTQVQGGRETTFKAGDSFYEAPNTVHLVSANASTAEPAKFVAYFVCDHDTPLSVNTVDDAHTKGESR